MECGRYDPEICEKDCPGRTDRRTSVKYADTDRSNSAPCGSEAPCGRTCDRRSGKCDGNHEILSGCWLSPRAVAWWHDKKKK